MEDSRVTYLQRYRKARNMSQSELAEKVGMSVRTLQAIESGARDINKVAAITALKLAEALNCKIEDILELDE